MNTMTERERVLTILTALQEGAMGYSPSFHDAYYSEECSECRDMAEALEHAMLAIRNGQTADEYCASLRSN